MPISGRGWELHIRRLEVQTNGDLRRTYGEYETFLDGAQLGLSGHVCECAGPGDNGATGSAGHRRIEAKSYPLSTHFGTYVSTGYSPDTEHAGMAPMPGVMLTRTGHRKWILIHPGHPPHLYLSSIGCLNLTAPLMADKVMDFWDSRTRVIDILDSLKAFVPAAFMSSEDTPIPNAQVVIDGEP